MSPMNTTYHSVFNEQSVASVFNVLYITSDCYFSSFLFKYLAHNRNTVILSGIWDAHDFITELPGVPLHGQQI